MSEVPGTPNITEQFAVIADHLCVNVGKCTCDGPFEGYGHRPECEFEPLLTLAELATVLGRAGCIVIQLPESDVDEYGPRWDTGRDMPIRVEVDGGPPVVWDGDRDFDPDEFEGHCLAGLAAVREVRRLVSGSSGHGTENTDA